MKVLIIGAGYVGLTTATILSKAHQVTILEVLEDKVSKINSGKSPIHEAGLDQLLELALKENGMRAITPNGPIGEQDVVLICVGTPARDDGSVNLDYIKGASYSLLEKTAEIAGDFCAIGIKSTVPPGTTRQYLHDRIHELGFSATLGAFFNPEFLQEGSAVKDAQNPDRIVIGTHEDRVFNRVRQMYQAALEKSAIPYLRMSLESAELCKYVSNSFLATKISFANEMADIAESIPHADIGDVFRAAGMDERISPYFFGAGIGFGGSCFPKDVSGLAEFAKNDLSVHTPMLETTLKINSLRPKKVVSLLRECLGSLKGKKIAILGYAFKPETDDSRHSQSLPIIKELDQLGSSVYVHDPLAKKMGLEDDYSEQVILTDDLNLSLDDASGCVLATDWDEYANTGLETMTQNMKRKLFIDGRRVFADGRIPDDIEYYTIGSNRWWRK
jgi:UDPglucose 6-dehydrogenase